jgi:TolA-binding protein
MQVLVDTSKKYAGLIISTFGLSVIVTIWSVFVRPQVVMASDLQEVNTQVQAVKLEVSELKTSVNLVNINQVEFRIDYLQDRIRELEAKQAGKRLSEEETYRLSDYRDRLSKAQRMLNLLEK